MFPLIFQLVRSERIYKGIELASPEGFEPPQIDLEAIVLPDYTTDPSKCALGCTTGFEPA